MMLASKINQRFSKIEIPNHIVIIPYITFSSTSNTGIIPSNNTNTNCFQDKNKVTYLFYKKNYSHPNNYVIPYSYI